MLSPQFLKQEDRTYSQNSNDSITWLRAPERKQNPKLVFYNLPSQPTEQQLEDITFNRNRIKANFKSNLSVIISKSFDFDDTDLNESEGLELFNYTQFKSSKRIALSAEKLSTKLELEMSYFQSNKIILNVSQYYNCYEVLETIGEGCIGLVKRVMHRETGQFFAVKMVATTDEEIIRNMVIEFNNLVKLSHENIVKMHELYIDYNDGFQSESRAFIIMDFIDGKEMFDVINDLGHYSEMHAKQLFQQLLSAIGFLHKHGVCHRDLKPNNILCLKDSNTIKITDFNVSKFSETYKEYGNLQDLEKIEMWTYTGTVAFSAPEIFSGGGYSQMVDMWSAGCILYSMLSGSLPFTSIYLNDLVEDIKKGDFDFPPAQFGSISDEAKDLISKLLQKEPMDRLQPDSALNHPWFDLENTQSRRTTLCNLTIKDHIHQLTSKHSPQKHRVKNDTMAITPNLKSSQSDIDFQPTMRRSYRNGYFVKQFRLVQSEDVLPSVQDP